MCSLCPWRSKPWWGLQADDQSSVCLVHPCPCSSRGTGSQRRLTQALPQGLLCLFHLKRWRSWLPSCSSNLNLNLKAVGLVLLHPSSFSRTEVLAGLTMLSWASGRSIPWWSGCRRLCTPWWLASLLQLSSLWSKCTRVPSCMPGEGTEKSEYLYFMEYLQILTRHSVLVANGDRGECELNEPK